ncbi:MAG TPA: hypothetical protein VF712_12620 [Thermoleophilaceae bacterium]|jgi:hypothetical protein
MAICLIYENPDYGREQAEEVIANVAGSGPVPPEGARLVFGGPAEPGWRMISVWDSEEALERFLGGRLADALEAAGVPRENERRTTFEVYKLTAGDLTGAPQPA